MKISDPLTQEDSVGVSSSNREGPPVWRAGTLAYSTGGLVVVFCWLLLGDFAWSLKERAVFPMAQFLLKKFEASDFIVGLMVGTLPNLMAVCLQPIITMRSDRHRGPLGRRIPYLLWTTPITSVSLAALAFSPVFGLYANDWLGSYSPGPTILMLVYFAVFWVAYEYGTLVVEVIFGSLINDVVPSRFLGRFYGLFRGLSLMAGVIFNYWLFGHVESYYVFIFLGLALIYAIGFFLVCWRVKEGTYPEPQPLPAVGPKGYIRNMKQYFIECFNKPYYRWVLIAYSCCILAFYPINMFSFFFARSVGLGLDSYGKYIALTLSISFVLSYILGVLADRFHPLRVGMVAIFSYAALTLWGGVFIDSPDTFAFAYVAHGVLAGSFQTSTASICQRLFPRARFAQFFSAQQLVLSAGVIIVPPLVGLMLDASGHVYRYTFLCSAGIATCGFVGLTILYRKFLALGGHENYQPPE